MRIATYARYSSDNQSPLSIVDQQRLCREYAADRNWSVVGEFADAAISGATLHRPGVRALLTLAQDGGCDGVLMEALDRLSRDQADTASIHKRLLFAGIKLFTIRDGEVTKLVVGFKGTMNAIYLDDLADKTRRGLRGVVADGRSAGGHAFGYTTKKGSTPGTLAISRSEADIVVRVFREYAAGQSPRRIAKQLNADAVVSPSGGTWSPSTIHGNKKRGTGVLNNELYVGRRVWNRLQYRKNPDTGRRQSRPNAPSEWVIEQVPSLRIVEQALWDVVKERQLRSTCNRTNLHQAHRPKYLLSGLLRCGACGGRFTLASHDRLACPNSRNRGTCKNRRILKRGQVERRVLEAIREQFLDAEAYRAFRDGFEKEIEVLDRAARSGQTSVRREIMAAEKQVAHYVDALGSGLVSEAVTRALQKTEAQLALLRARLEWRWPAAPPADLPELFRAEFGQLVENLEGPERLEAQERIRQHVDHVLIPEGELPYKLVGNVTMLLGPDLGSIVGCGGGI